MRNRTSHLCASIALVFGSSFALASCATDPSDTGDDQVDEPGNDLPTASTEQDLSSNERAAFNYFVARGLTKKQSAGIVGNLIQESSVRPTAIEFGGGPGRGIAQWSVGGRWNASHHDNVAWYAAQHGQSRWSLNTQLAFTWYELHSVGGYGLTALRHATTIKAATIAFERDFEKCGNCQEAKRYNYALQVYRAFANTARFAPDGTVDTTDDAELADAVDELPTDDQLTDDEE